jgi:hypothetical protein
VTSHPTLWITSTHTAEPPDGSFCPFYATITLSKKPFGKFQIKEVVITVGEGAENPEEFNALLEDLKVQLAPAGTLEEMLNVKSLSLSEIRC